MPTKDKSKIKEYNARYYQKRPWIYRERNIRIRARNRKYLEEYLLSHPCVDCGNSDIRVLDFDHVRGKKKRAVSVMSIRMVSLETLQIEIDKCEIRCANCHRIATWERRNIGA